MISFTPMKLSLECNGYLMMKPSISWEEEKRIDIECLKNEKKNFFLLKKDT